MQRKNLEKTNDGRSRESLPTPSPTHSHTHTQSTHSLFIKVNITVTLRKIFSLAVVEKLGPAGRIGIFFSSFFLFVFVGLEALPTCVIVWPLSACLPQRAVLCSSPQPAPHPLRAPPPPRHCSLDASLRIPTDRLLLPYFSQASRPIAARRNCPAPCVLNLKLLLHQSLSSANLSCSVSLLQGSPDPQTETFDLCS